MGTQTRYIGCHPFAYTDDKIGMQDNAIFVEIVIIQSTVCTFSDYVERCIKQVTAKRKFHLFLFLFKEAGVFRPIASD